MYQLNFPTVLKRVGNDDVWDKSEAALREAMEATGLEYTLNAGEGAFMGQN